MTFGIGRGFAEVQILKKVRLLQNDIFAYKLVYLQDVAHEIGK